MDIKFNIPGKPQAKQRPRFTGHHAYTPKETVAYENWVRLCFQQTKAQKLTGEILSEMIFTFPIAASKSKKIKAKMMSGETCPTGKPDLDNLAKSVLDSLNGFAFDDDSQVVMLLVRKKYGTDPGVQVSLYDRTDEGEIEWPGM